MKILALSDKVLEQLHDTRIRERYHDVDLLVGCGDLPSRYLEFILTVLGKPLVYVPGNHDPDDLQVPGGRSADARLLRESGLLIFGLGGSIRYKQDGMHQYTDPEMGRRYLSHLPRFLWNRFRTGRAFDLLVTHAPPAGIHDREDHAHHGFDAFLRLLDLARPALMLHGHTHALPNIEATRSVWGQTTILNVYPYRCFQWTFQRPA